MKHGKGKSMVWGCMSTIVAGGLHKIDCIMENKKYQIFLNHEVPSRLCLIGKGFSHQEDNDLKHS
jgi:hypothetical protein